MTIRFEGNEPAGLRDFLAGILSPDDSIVVGAAVEARLDGDGAGVAYPLPDDPFGPFAYAYVNPDGRWEIT